MYHPDGEMLEMDWACHLSRSFHCENCVTSIGRWEAHGDWIMEKKLRTWERPGEASGL